MKQIAQYYSFDKTAKTITFTELVSIKLENILLITNTKTGDVLYQFNSPTLTATVSGNVLTLTGPTSTSAMSNSDPIEIIYDDGHDYNLVASERKKFRDGFATPFATPGVPDPATWTLSNPDSHVITQGGNSSASSYLRISLNPLLESSEVTLTSKDTFRFPIRTGYGVSISQRVVGQEIFAGIAGDDGAGGIQTITNANRWNANSDMAITQVVILTNVATVTTASAHGLTGGDRLSFYGFTDSRFNIGPVVVTGLTATTFTVPLVAPNATYSTGMGYIRYSDPLRYAYNAAGYLFENATVTNASLVTRRNGSRFRSLNSTVTTTTALQSNTSPYTDAFNTASIFEQQCLLEEVTFRSFASDGVATANITKYSQGIPDEDLGYRIYFRARTQTGYTRPVARITAIAKTGTTTATVTTDVAHGLNANDWVQVYGVRDQANFPNLTTSTQVSSIVDSTHFTIIIGTATTTSSLDGTVIRNQGSALAAAGGYFTQVIQNAQATGNVLTLTGNSNWATPLPGEMMYVYGLTSGLSAYEGAYKVLRVSTTTLELTPATGTISDVGSTATGGVLIRMTDVRLHFARVLDHTRTAVEVYGGRGNTTDINNSVPVSITGGATLNINSPAVTQSTGVNTTQWSAAGWGGFLVNDVASAAITSTATTAATTPGSIANIGTYAHSFNVIVTAVSGTTPTMDIGVEESMDNGTNWTRIYDFPRITATGAYTSPVIPAVYGTRYRYVQTIAGTTPSFTRAINRNQFSRTAPLYRSFIDRTIAPNTLNSTTPTWLVDGAGKVQLLVKMGAITTTAPTLVVEASEDTVDWYTLPSATYTPTANSNDGITVVNVLPRFIRVRVSVAGSGATLTAVNLKAVE